MKQLCLTDKKPLWEHDCWKCQFLGRKLIAGEWHDLYICPRPASDEFCIVNRWDNGNEASSNWGFRRGLIPSFPPPEVQEAGKLAKAQDLWPPWADP